MSKYAKVFGKMISNVWIHIGWHDIVYRVDCKCEPTLKLEKFSQQFSRQIHKIWTIFHPFICLITPSPSPPPLPHPYIYILKLKWNALACECNLFHIEFRWCGGTIRFKCVFCFSHKKIMALFPISNTFHCSCFFVLRHIFRWGGNHMRILNECIHMKFPNEIIHVFYMLYSRRFGCIPKYWLSQCYGECWRSRSLMEILNIILFMMMTWWQFCNCMFWKFKTQCYFELVAESTASPLCALTDTNSS